jgi:acylphosphatase
VAEGDPTALAELERRLHQGPPGAHVEQVEARRHAASGEYDSFGIVRS